jgi:hypothetical protein
MHTESLLILLIAGLVWLWFDGQRAWESAVETCRRCCQEHGLQLLDQTVALCRFGLGRNDDGRLKIRRQYSFEYSMQGNDRGRGRATVLGAWVESVELDPPRADATWRGRQ